MISLTHDEIGPEREPVRSVWPETSRSLLARPLGEWLADPGILTPPKVLVPHLAVVGRVTLLSGREKVGKSSLIGQAVAQLSVGGELFGVACKANTTLWYAVDEPVADTVRRLEHHGADPSSVLICDAPRNLKELHQSLEANLERHPRIALVVLDTLSKLFSLSGIDPNDAKSVEPPMAKLVDFCHANKVSAVLLYHTGKSGLEYRGSTAIGASVDEIVTLRQPRGREDEHDEGEAPREDDGRRFLIQVGRTFRDTLHLTRIEGAYCLFESAPPVRDRIIAALVARGPASSRNELSRLVGGRRADVLREISVMVSDRDLVERDGKLCLPEPSSSPSASAPTIPPASGPRSTDDGNGSDDDKLVAFFDEEPAGNQRGDQRQTSRPPERYPAVNPQPNTREPAPTSELSSELLRLSKEAPAGLFKLDERAAEECLARLFGTKLQRELWHRIYRVLTSSATTATELWLLSEEAQQ